MIWTPAQPALQSLLAALEQQIKPVYVVGGVVRDHLLGVPSQQNDLDVVVEHSAGVVARQVADRLGWAYYPLDPVRDVARLIFMAGSRPLVCDIAAMRGGAIETDLRARDFTVNAMAYAWEGRGASRLVDLLGGQIDLQRRVLRRATPSSLVEDPVRLLRAVRFAVQLGFSVEEETQAQILRMGDTLRLVSVERIRDELWKMLACQAPQQAIELLRQDGLLRYVLPEIAELEGVSQTPPHAYDVYGHTLHTMEFVLDIRNWLKGGPAAAPNGQRKAWQDALAPWLFRLRQHFLQPVAADHLRVEWLMWHALLHDVGKLATRSIEGTADGGERVRFFGHEEAGAALAAERLETLRFSRQEIALAQTVVEHHMRPAQLNRAFAAAPLSRRAMFRYFRDTGTRPGATLTGVDVLLLALADLQAKDAAVQPAGWDEFLRHSGELLDYAYSRGGLAQAQQPLIDGHTLMQHFHLTPGRQVGALLIQLQEAQAAGEISTPAEALALAADLVQKMGD